MDGDYYSAVCHDLTSTSGNTYTIAYSSSDLSIYGSVVLESGLTFSTSTLIYFLSSGSETITTNGGTLNYSVFGGGGTWTLQDNLVVVNELLIFSGTFDANDYNVSALSFKIYADGSDLTVYMGSGTWIVEADGWLVDEAGFDATINCETSTIKTTYAGANCVSFTGAGKTYYNLWHNGDSDLLIADDSNTFNDFKVDHGGTKNVLFLTGTTTTVNSFSVNGTATNSLTLNKSGVDGQFTLSKSSGTVDCEYLDISNSNATGGATWIAKHSTDSGNNTGWIFGDPVFPTVSTLLLTDGTDTFALGANDTVGELTLTSIESTVEATIDGLAHFDTVSRLLLVDKDQTVSSPQSWGVVNRGHSGWVEPANSTTTWSQTISNSTPWQ